MSKHTPGPWVIGEHVPTARIDNARMIRPADHHNYDYGATAIIGTSEGNARLIAAAPELLQSLREVIQYFDAPGDGCFSDAQLAKARAAIAKATGGKG